MKFYERIFKKNFFIIIILTLTIIQISTTKNLNAIELSVGPTVWYTWWDPLFAKATEDFEIEPALQYGGAVSLRFFEKFNIGFRLMVGEYQASWRQTIYYSNGSRSEVTCKNVAIGRINMDLIVGYTLIQRLQLYIGYKLQSYSISHQSSYIFYNQLNQIQYLIIPYGLETARWGPGLGIAYSKKIIDRLFLISNMSFIYINYNNYMKYPGLALPELQGTPLQTLYPEGKLLSTPTDHMAFVMNADAYGINANFSLSYYIAPISSSISIGYRYQRLLIKTKSVYIQADAFPLDYGSVTDDIYNGKYETFQGITFSTLYYY